MSTLRAFVTFILLLIVVVLAIFQMDIRGYQELGRINEYVLYETEVDVCQDQLYTVDTTEYRILCENRYIFKSGFAEYTIVEALEEGIIDVDEMLDYIDYLEE